MSAFKRVSEGEFTFSANGSLKQSLSVQCLLSDSIRMHSVELLELCPSC